MAFIKHPLAVAAVVLVLAISSLPSRIDATSRLMPSATTATGILRTPRVPQSTVRQLRQVQVMPEEVAKSMDKFRAVDAALLKAISEDQPGAKEQYLLIFEGIIGCDGAVPCKDASMAYSASLALRSTSGQYPELEPYIELRDSLIQDALAAVKATPITSDQCVKSQQLADSLGIPETATAVFGHRKAT